MSKDIEVNKNVANGHVEPLIHSSARDPFELQISSTPFLADPEKEAVTDQVFALIFNEQNEALILEAPRAQGWPEWQLVQASLPLHEDPLPFAKHELLEVAGYVSNEWIYLGSYRLNSQDEEGACHFFCARHACPAPTAVSSRPLRWVKRHELRHGLIDGRVSSLSIGLTISLSLLLG